jgi:hypothetical protein
MCPIPNGFQRILHCTVGWICVCVCEGGGKRSGPCPLHRILDHREFSKVVGTLCEYGMFPSAHVSSE